MPVILLKLVTASTLLFFLGTGCSNQIINSPSSDNDFVANVSDDDNNNNDVNLFDSEDADISDDDVQTNDRQYDAETSEAEAQDIEVSDADTAIICRDGRESYAVEPKPAVFENGYLDCRDSFKRKIELIGPYCARAEVLCSWDYSTTEMNKVYPYCILVSIDWGLMPDNTPAYSQVEVAGEVVRGIWKDYSENAILKGYEDVCQIIHTIYSGDYNITFVP